MHFLQGIKRLKRIFLLCWAFMLIFPNQVFAYTLLILREPGTESYVNSFKNKVKEVEPFKYMDFEIKVIEGSREKLDCNVYINIKNGHKILKCNDNYILDQVSKYNADHALVISDKKESIASAGGTIARVTTSMLNIKNNLSVVIHELLHLMGFGDEYPFPDNKLNRLKCTWYKRRQMSEHNLIYLDQESYTSDEEVRQKISDKVPWLEQIPPETPITHINKDGKRVLGSPPNSPPGTVGLFEADTCAVYGIKLWKPVRGNTIMKYAEDIDYIHNVFHAPILDYMKSKTSIPPKSIVEKNPKPLTPEEESGQ